MKTIYFVRHGESEANAAGITAGGGLDVPLTKKGEFQAEMAAKELKKKNIDLIVSSPMKRAVATANIIAKGVKYDSSKIVTNKLFIERHIGSLTGKPNDVVKASFDAKALPPDVETTETMYARIMQGLEWLKEQDASHIVVISHGGPARMVRLIAQGLEHSHLHLMERMGNSEIFEFEL